MIPIAHNEFRETNIIYQKHLGVILEKLAFDHHLSEKFAKANKGKLNNKTA